MKPEHFIGVHFFSPVEKMMLVEIIMGEKTDPKALATAMDFVRAIKKTPIVVNDCRGFYVNRCVGNYMVEAHAMVMEGVPPAMVENAAKMAGMPVGPLALNDEVGDRSELEDPSGDQEGSGRERRRSGPGEAHRGDGRQGQSLRPQERQGLLRLSGQRTKEPVAGTGEDRRQDGSIPTRSASRISKIATCSPRRSRPRVACSRASSPIRARLTSARSSASAMRLIPAARCRSSTAWGRRLSSRARKISRRNTAPRFEPADKLVQMAERGETFYGTYGEKQRAA